MAIKINSATFTGINGTIVDVEIDIIPGLPAFNIVGLGDISVKEFKERVRSAIINSGFEFPMGRITINLAPADLKKEGSLFDLPIALGILMLTEQVNMNDKENFIFMGELSLLGELKKVRGALPIIIEGINNEINQFIVPVGNAEESKLLIEWKYAECKSIDWIANEMYAGARSTAYRKREELIEGIAQWINIMK